MTKINELAPETYFSGQRPGEEVEFILFKHWYTLAAPIVKAFAIIFASLAIPIWLHFMKFIFSYGALAFVYYVWQVFWIVSIIYSYIRWYQDRFIVTNERIINIDQQGLFKKKVSEVELGRIQNITHEVNGFFATLLSFGTVEIESAGASQLVLAHIADPAGVQEDITRLVRSAGVAPSSTDTEELLELMKKVKRDRRQTEESGDEEA